MRALLTGLHLPSLLIAPQEESVVLLLQPTQPSASLMRRELINPNKHAACDKGRSSEKCFGI